jgi:hypothetical protein
VPFGLDAWISSGGNVEMNDMKKQRGAAPLILIVALVAALIGGYLGWNLGDGTWFGFGVGVGIVLVSFRLLLPYGEQIRKTFQKKAGK